MRMMNKEQIYRRLRELTEEERILRDEPMERHCSFRTGGPAAFFLKVADKQELPGIMEFLQEAGMPVFLLGRGSNILVADRGYEGVIIQMEDSGAAVTAEGSRLRVQAGVSMGRAAAAAREYGLHGLEFAAGIPGSVGGGIVMNAGAYGSEMKDVVESAELLFPDGTFRQLAGTELHFGYRTSLLKETAAVVTEVVFSLEPGDPEEIRSRTEELLLQRKSKQPLEYPSAGSTFKRPEGYFAGKLIQDAGLRGYRIGGAQVSEKHCGFVINRENATSGDIAGLIAYVQQKVLETSGVQLEREVIYLGF